MNIAIVIKNMHGYAGTENIASFMSRVMSKHHKVFIISYEGNESDEPFYEYNYERCYKLSSLYSEGSIKNIIKEENITKVFVISMGKLSVSFFLKNIRLFFNKRIKIFSCEHVSIKSFNTFKKFIKILTLKFYNKVICLTSTDKVFFDRFLINSLVIENPITFKSFDRKSRTKKALAVGRLNNQKGFERLLLIWSNFIKTNPEWILNIAGDGEELNNLLEYCESYSISDSVNFLGKVDRLDELYQKSDLFLMTSHYEGLPMVLLEAKSWSLPCIAFNCPTGPKEIIENNVDGFLIQNGNFNSYVEAMKLLSSDDELYFDFVRSTKFTHKKFSVDIVKEKWVLLSNE